MSLISLSLIALSDIEPGGLPHQSGIGSNDVQTVLTIVFAIIGAISLLVITVSGLRYILATGDPQKMSNAKNGIIYSLIGLLIAITAQAIAAFVVGRL